VAPAPPPAAAAASPATVTIANYAFAPETLTVPVGTAVSWTNADGSPHSVKFADQGDSGKFGKGGTFKRTFESPGVYDYECGLHASMKGKVIVQ
ncbi:MAG TPA: cupredoxin domain-containing protein, partial [Nevskiaceae bacterium]|nr:cupredoxin domain-containing protein [Nevskiaceae bacterium]